VEHLSLLEEACTRIDPRLVGAVSHQEDKGHTFGERRIGEPAGHRRRDAPAPELLPDANRGQFRHAVIRRDAETCTSRLARLGIPREHDDAARLGGAAESHDRTVRNGVAFLVRLPLHLRDAAKLDLGRRRNELNARGRIEDGRLAGHQRESPLNLEPGCEEQGLDCGSDRRDVLEPRLSLAGLVGGDERLDVGGGGDAAVIRDGVIEKGVGRVAGEGREERADSLGLAATRCVVTKRFLDPS